MYKLLITILLLLNVASSNANDVRVYALFPDMVVLEISGQQRQLRVGDVSPEGIKLISSNGDVAILEMLGVRKQYSLGTRFSVKISTENTAPTTARIGKVNGMYSTAGSINGQPVSFLVDTGASWVVMNSRVARRLGINYRYKGTKSTAETASGTANVYLVSLDKIQVGTITLRNVQGAVIENYRSDEILLGMSFLSRVDMRRDGSILLLQKR